MRILVLVGNISAGHYSLIPTLVGVSALTRLRATDLEAGLTSSLPPNGTAWHLTPSQDAPTGLTLSPSSPPAPTLIASATEATEPAGSEHYQCLGLRFQTGT